ncbi:MAG: NepR family anti-sigma factor [Rhodospirillales bacterium]
MSSANQKTEDRSPRGEDDPERGEQGKERPAISIRSEAGRERIQRAWLSRGLRDLFQDTVSEPVPDSFKSLLEELERKEREKDSGDQPKGDV